MANSKPQELSTQREQEIITLETKKGFSVVLMFGLVLLGLTIMFLLVRTLIAQLFGQSMIIVDFASLIFQIVIAAIGTYYYYTRYVKRSITFEPESFTLSVGKRIFTFNWSEFSLVVLSTAAATYGMKGYIIRLYEDDLDSDYAEIPIYRFPDADTFEFRRLVEERVSLAKGKTEETQDQLPTDANDLQNSN